MFLRVVLWNGLPFLEPSEARKLWEDLPDESVREPGAQACKAYCLVGFAGTRKGAPGSGKGQDHDNDDHENIDNFEANLCDAMREARAKKRQDLREKLNHVRQHEGMDHESFKTLVNDYMHVPDVWGDSGGNLKPFSSTFAPTTAAKGEAGKAPISYLNRFSNL